MTQVNLFMKKTQTHRHREQTCSCPGGGGVWGRDEVGVWIIRCKMITYRMGKQGGSTV